MNEEQNINEPQLPAFLQGAVISCFYSLHDSVKVVLVIFTFIFLLFFGVIIAPILTISKWLYAVYCKYYDWLFDWYVSKNSL